MQNPAWTLRIPRAAKLAVPIDFQWADDKTARDVSGVDAVLVAYLSPNPVTVDLSQVSGVTSRKLLSTTAATFPNTLGKTEAEITLVLNGEVIDRLFGHLYVDGP